MSNINLIKMHRDTPEHKGAPLEHLSHPDNVAAAEKRGWKVTPTAVVSPHVLAGERGQVPGPDQGQTRGRAKK
jgi:hypothetical protein